MRNFRTAKVPHILSAKNGVGGGGGGGGVEVAYNAFEILMSS